MKNRQNKLSLPQEDSIRKGEVVHEVDEQMRVTMKSRVPSGKKAIIIVRGCTDQFQETIEPINVVMNVLMIPIIERLIVPHVGITEDGTVDKKEDVMAKAYEIGRRLV